MPEASVDGPQANETLYDVLLVERKFAGLVGAFLSLADSADSGEAGTGSGETGSSDAQAAITASATHRMVFLKSFISTSPPWLPDDSSWDPAAHRYHGRRGPRKGCSTKKDDFRGFQNTGGGLRVILRHPEMGSRRVVDSIQVGRDGGELA
jgi:hypothetical protein